MTGRDISPIARELADIQARLLCTPFDAQIIESADAIKRLLRANVFDLEDLVAAIAQLRESPPPQSASPAPEHDHNVCDLVDVVDRCVDAELGTTFRATLSRVCVRCGTGAGTIYRVEPHWRCDCAGCGAFIKFLPKAHLIQKLDEFKRGLRHP